jgi:hypothetical protein
LLCATSPLRDWHVRCGVCSAGIITVTNPCAQPTARPRCTACPRQANLLARVKRPAQAVYRTCRKRPSTALLADGAPMEGQERKRATRGEQHTTACKRPTTTIEREDTQESEKEGGRKERSGVPRKWQAGTRNGDRQETKSEHGADLPRVNCQSAKPSTEPFRTLSRIVMGLCQAWLPERPHTLMVEAQLPEVTSPHGCDAQLGNRNPPSCCAAQPVEPSYTLVHSDGPPPQYSSSFLKSAATAPVTCSHSWRRLGRHSRHMSLATP